MGVVEKLVSIVRQSEQEAAMYVCRGCGMQFDIQYYQCPECGGYHIDRIDWDLDRTRD